MSVVDNMEIEIIVLRQQLESLVSIEGPHQDEADKSVTLVDFMRLKKYKSLQQKLNIYRSAWTSILTFTGDNVQTAMKIFIDAMVDENVSLLILRELLIDVTATLVKMPERMLRELSQHMLDKIKPRMIYVEEQMAKIRVHLIDVFEREKLWQDAAYMILGLPLAVGQVKYTVDEKLKIYLKVASYYLAEGDPRKAGLYVADASLLQAQSYDELLRIDYKAMYTRVLDHQYKFFDAAHRYNMISNYELIKGDKLKTMTMIGNALICAVLATPGKQRSRLLVKLVDDVRYQQLPGFSVLKKIRMERFVRSNDFEEFVPLLQPHQKAIAATGSTILERAAIEHNLIVAKELYKSIKLDHLGNMMQIEAIKAERIAREMIIEGRLDATIDRIDSVLNFETDTPVKQWQNRIQALCEDVNRFVERISKANPEWVVKYLNDQTDSLKDNC